VRKRVLIVDDDDVIRAGLMRSLEARGFETEQAAGWGCLKERVHAFQPDAIVMDHLLGDGEGVHLLAQLRALAPTVPIVILTGHGSINLAVLAMRSGASHFLTKPVDPSELAVVLQSVISPVNRPQRTRSGAQQKVVLSKRGLDPFLGVSDEIKRLRQQAESVRDKDRPVLILGETGTGKSVLARWLHETGPRASAGFVDLNCSAFAKELLESELFGHERGAFTGAQAAKMGLVEAAEGGTLFLDEIGDMDVALQPKLLKVLEEKRLRRLGAVRDRAVDVRLISATHQDLATAVRDRRFRADLYYRICAFPLLLTPLRSRRDDIPAIARDLMAHLGAEMGRGPAELTSAAIERLCAYSWPGNTRELKNVLDRALCLTERNVIDAHDLVFAVESYGPEATTGTRRTSVTSLRVVEAEMIEQALRDAGGRVSDAAGRLGMPRSTLYNKIKLLGIKVAK
jgi:DNA-binding NtrC family response regulator